MKKRLADCKNPFVYAFWSTVNRIVVTRHFRSIEVSGGQPIPRKGGFILVSNHITRWDGLLWYHLIGRPSNFMVSPNELLGFQGTVLKSMGAFPASAKFNLQDYVNQQLAKGEGVVVFPEGDIYRDGTTHRFKSGVARLALNALSAGMDVPIIPAAIRYADDGARACVAVAPAVRASEYKETQFAGAADAARVLSDRLHREVCHLRVSLGCASDGIGLYGNQPTGSWTLAS